MDTPAKRLRFARMLKGITLADLGHLTGYAVSTLSNLEQGHDQPTSPVVTAIVRALGVRDDWVWKGAGPIFDHTELALRSMEAWIGTARLRAERLRKEIGSRTEDLRELEIQIETAEKKVGAARSGKFKAEWRLTGGVTLWDKSEMGSQLDRLVADLRRLTAAKGKKTQLAEFMGVPLPRVSEWLARRKNPSGETALRLQNWVKQQEAEKRPGSAKTPPEPGPV